MPRRTPLFVVLAVTLLLTGCSSPTPGSDTSSVTSFAAVPGVDGAATALRVTTSELELVGANGIALQTIPFTEGQEILELLTLHLGSAPTATPVAASSVMTYGWDGVTLALESDRYAVVTFSAATSAGLELHGPQGVQIGWTQSDVADVAQSGPDLNGDTLPDEFRIDAVQVPDTTSNFDQTTTGTTYVRVRLDASGTVETITAPGRDYGTNAP